MKLAPPSRKVTNRIIAQCRQELARFGVNVELYTPEVTWAGNRDADGWGLVDVHFHLIGDDLAYIAIENVMYDLSGEVRQWDVPELRG